MTAYVVVVNDVEVVAVLTVLLMVPWFWGVARFVRWGNRRLDRRAQSGRTDG